MWVLYYYCSYINELQHNVGYNKIEVERKFVCVVTNLFIIDTNDFSTIFYRIGHKYSKHKI